MASRRAFPTQVMSCVLALALLAGCSQPSPQAPLVTPSATPNSATSGTDAPVTPSATPSAIATGTDADRTAAYSRVQSELTDFLAVWKTKGYAEASKAYLAPDMQATSSDDVLVLSSGRVVTVRPDQWTSKDLFVVYVDFDLTFSGSTGAWGTGVNSRFVTATARTGTIPYVFEFATGP
jgi:hypothetical protein